jgi:hypothetical protein
VLAARKEPQAWQDLQETVRSHPHPKGGYRDGQEYSPTRHLT